MTTARSRLKGEQGSGLIEFSILAPVLLAVIGLAMFSAHIYEVSSDLQRVAERTAKYAAVQCDPRNKVVASQCTANGYHTPAQVQAFANSAFPSGHFVIPASGCPAKSKAICITYSPNRSDSPVPSQSVNIRLRFTYEEPFVGFLRAVSLDSALVDLTGNGDSTVE